MNILKKTIEYLIKIFKKINIETSMIAFNREFFEMDNLKEKNKIKWKEQKNLYKIIIFYY